MVAEFRGAPPHDLGTAELAMARGVDKDIEGCTCSTIGIVRQIKSFACGWRLLRRARLRIGYGPSRKRWTSNSSARLNDVANLPGPRMRSCTSSSSMRGMLAQLRAIVLRRRSSPAGLSNWGWRHSVHRS